VIRPWIVLRQRWVFHDRWYRLLAETVVPGEDREPIEYYTGVFADVALVVALTTGGEILFARQYKHGAREILVELPGGYLDEGEEPLAAAQRELLEETGFAGQDWRPLGSYLGNPTKERGNRLHFYLVTGATRVAAPHRDSTEEIEVLAIPVREVYSERFLAELRVLGTRLALELARPALSELGLIP
jgi:8-oxo-dGTP pyrophosphatase MutT (NUDIX family)